MRLASAVLAGLLALLPPAAGFASPLVNSGFEAGVLDPWFQGIGTLDRPLDEFWSTTTSTAAAGSWSAQNVGNNELRQNFAPIATSSILEVSFFLRKEGIIGLETAVQFHYDDGSFTQTLVSASDFDVWEQQDVTGELEPGRQLAGISFFGVRTDVGTRTYVDEVVIAVPEPGTCSLLGLGLCLLGRRPRRKVGFEAASAELTGQVLPVRAVPGRQLTRRRG